MSEPMIRIPRQDPQVNKSGVIKVSPEAVNALLKVAQHTNLGIKAIASTIIIQAVEGGLIKYEGTEDD